MPRKKKEPMRLAVIDAETDPFLFGRVPKPFSWGFYDGETYKEFWGDNCTRELLDYLISRKEPLVIYAHNGGKFDFFFLMEYGAIENPALIINGRIVKAQALGIHQIRDSYAILPVALKKIADGAVGVKKEIDYALMEKEVRENNKAEILAYLKQDCVVLWNIVFKFRERYADKLTVGAMAISELEKFHPIMRQNEAHDLKFRPFYFGGRVQCFKQGELIAPPGKVWKIYDVNSMYPYAMAEFIHPSGGNYIRLLGDDALQRFNRKTGDIKGFTGMYFIRFTGRNIGALPIRDAETGRLKFDCNYGEFNSTSHEVKTALELGLITVDSIHEIYIPCTFGSFKEFVVTYMREKVSAKLAKREADELFAKFTLNSAYGKFASNAAEFKEWYIYDNQGTWEEHEAFENWRETHPVIKGGKDGRAISLGAELVHIQGRFEIWSAPNPSDRGYFDVAIAASITSAARSVLLRAIHGATEPLYCDTDSLMCLELDQKKVHIHETDLGAWKFEGSMTTLYIAGRKMYSCMLDQLGKDGLPKNKIASKGAHLSHGDIIELCRGNAVTWQNDAPNFKFDGSTKFVARKIRSQAMIEKDRKEFAQKKKA